MLLAPLLSCPWIPHDLPLAKAPSAIPPTLEGPGLKCLPNNLLVDSGLTPIKAKKGPDPVNQPCRWIHVEMERIRHPCCWKEISQWESIHGQPHYKKRLQGLWGPALCPMAGSGLQAANHPAGGLWFVGCPTLAQQTLAQGFYAPHQCLWP